MQGSTYPQVRQLAATLLRGRLGKVWSKLDNGVKESMKAALLNGLLQEQERSIRKYVAW